MADSSWAEISTDDFPGWEFTFSASAATDGWFHEPVFSVKAVRGDRRFLSCCSSLALAWRNVANAIRNAERRGTR